MESKNPIAEQQEQQLELQLKKVNDELKQNVNQLNTVQEDINRLERATELIDVQKRRKDELNKTRQQILRTKLSIFKKKYPHVYRICADTGTGRRIQNHTTICMTYDEAKQKQKVLHDNKSTRDMEYYIEIYELSESDIESISYI